MDNICTDKIFANIELLNTVICYGEGCRQTFPTIKPGGDFFFFFFFFYSGIFDIHTITSAFKSLPFFLDCQGFQFISINPSESNCGKGV